MGLSVHPKRLKTTILMVITTATMALATATILPNLTVQPRLVSAGEHRLYLIGAPIGPTKLLLGTALSCAATAVVVYLLPVTEQLKFLLANTAALIRFRFLGKKATPPPPLPPYAPNFCKAFEHICIHPGGPAVISSVQRGLGLPERHAEASRT
uniref:Uncharacterized protein n=1 Tax=Oryza brachyantha TaxID=4533 RepID=J3MD34_ORYBR